MSGRGAVRQAGRLALVGLLLAACGNPSPSPSASGPPGSATPTPSASASAEPSARSTPSPSGSLSIDRPYDANAILDAMRSSVRPGGVPDQLETEQIAAAVAEQVWTWSGRPYPALSIGGSCGPASCTLELSGTPAAGGGSDLYVFSVTPAGGQVALGAADLHGYPAELDAKLDEIVRADLPEERLKGLALTGATWRLPPDGGQFVAAYRSGGEEGSPAADVVVDLVARRVVEVREP